MRTKTIFDTSALRARILDNFDSLDTFADAVGMKPRTLKSRLNNETQFKATELIPICNLLDVHSDDEIDRLFFMEQGEFLRGRTKALIALTNDMTDEEFSLLMKIMDLTGGRPDRQQLAITWDGKMKDLPAALAQI